MLPLESVGMVGEGASECGGNVRVGQVAEGLGLVNQFEIENTDSRIQVDTKDLAKLIFGLIESVFRLHEAGGCAFEFSKASPLPELRPHWTQIVRLATLRV